MLHYLDKIIVCQAVVTLTKCIPLIDRNSGVKF